MQAIITTEREEILRRISLLDQEGMRSVLAILSGSGSQTDHDHLSDLATKRRQTETLLGDDPPVEDLSSLLRDLVAARNADIEDLNAKYLAAVIAGGAAEETKKARIREDIASRKAQYAADLAALMERFTPT